MTVWVDQEGPWIKTRWKARVKASLNRKAKAKASPNSPTQLLSQN